MSETKKAFEAIVHGRVQGVNFRYYTKLEAERLHVKGEVKNMPDGTVYVRAEGPEEILQDFIGFLHKGPGRSARVDDVSLSWYENLRNDSSFSVTF